MARPLLTILAILLAVIALLTIIMPERMAAVNTAGVLLVLGSAILAVMIAGRPLFISREEGGNAPQSPGEALRYILLWAGVVVLLVGVFRLFPGLEQWWISRRA